MLTLHPGLVQLDKAQDFRSAAQGLAPAHTHLGLSPAGRLGWQAQDLNPDGACGNATLATAEKGRACIDHAARQIALLLTEVQRAPLSMLDTPART